MVIGINIAQWSNHSKWQLIIIMQEMRETVLQVPGTCEVCVSCNVYDVTVAVIIMISVKNSACKQILM
jgi:hypothetical protein